MSDGNATEFCQYCEEMTRVGTETYLGAEIPHGVFNTIFGFNHGGGLYVIRQGTPEGVRLKRIDELIEEFEQIGRRCADD